jgi:hypothetical protein
MAANRSEHAMEALAMAGPKLHEKLAKGAAVYMDPVEGGFKCSNCDFFHTPRACELVEGSIDPEGCCNLFLPKDE